MEKQPKTNRNGETIHRGWGEIDDPTLQAPVVKKTIEETQRPWGRQAEEAGYTITRNWLPMDDPSIQG